MLGALDLKILALWHFSDDADQVVHTTVANVDVIAVKDLVKRVSLREVLVNRQEERFPFRCMSGS